MFAFKENDRWVEYTNQPLPLAGADGRYSVPAAWSDADKEERFGVHRVLETPSPAGKRLVSWSLIDDAGHPRKMDILEDVPLAELKAAKIAALAAKRWEVEHGGVVVGGISIRSDATGQAKITGAVSLFDNDPEMTVIDWEAQPGNWVTLDKLTMRTIGVAVGRHVQACFSCGRALFANIAEAADKATLDAIDIERGWPDSQFSR